MDARDVIALYNDSPDDISDLQLRPYGDEVHSAGRSIGTEAQRVQHFADFWNRREKEGFTHLLLTDPDIIFDPDWRSEALRIQAVFGLPLCAYNTDAHVRLVGNTIADDPASEVILRRVAPGVFYLLTIEHVRTVMKHLHEMNAFDWQIPAWLGGVFAVTRTSLCDHIGEGGLRHPDGAGLDGGDRALFPTPWLVAKRAAIIKELRANSISY